MRGAKCELVFFNNFIYLFILKKRKKKKTELNTRKTAILLWDPTINLINVIRFQNLFIAIAIFVVFMHFLYAVTVCKIVYINDVRMETVVLLLYRTSSPIMLFPVTSK